jgi:hypothetical protein
MLLRMWRFVSYWFSSILALYRFNVAQTLARTDSMRGCRLGSMGNGDKRINFRIIDGSHGVSLCPTKVV